MFAFDISRSNFYLFINSKHKYASNINTLFPENHLCENLCCTKYVLSVVVFICKIVAYFLSILQIEYSSSCYIHRTYAVTYLLYRYYLQREVNTWKYLFLIIQGLSRCCNYIPFGSWRKCRLPHNGKIIRGPFQTFHGTNDGENFATVGLYISVIG